MDEGTEAWRLSAGSANWRLSGASAMGMDGELQRLSRGFSKLDVRSDDLRSSLVTDANDGLGPYLADRSGESGDALSPNDQDIALRGSPPVPQRGIYRNSLRPGSDGFGQVAAGMSAGEAKSKAQQQPQNPGGLHSMMLEKLKAGKISQTDFDDMSMNSLLPDDADKWKHDSLGLSDPQHLSLSSVASIDLDLDVMLARDSMEMGNSEQPPLSEVNHTDDWGILSKTLNDDSECNAVDDRKRTRPISLEQLHKHETSTGSVPMQHRMKGSGAGPTSYAPVNRVSTNHRIDYPLFNHQSNRWPSNSGHGDGFNHANAHAVHFHHQQHHSLPAHTSVTFSGSVFLPVQTAKKGRKPPRHWRRSEDARLKEAVKTFGTADWNLIAKQVMTRTRAQCLYHWKNALNPTLKKGQWEASEDQLLRELHKSHGTDWKEIATHITGRNQKQCRERWCNHLDPTLKKGNWTEEEDRFIIERQARMGNKWSQIAKLMEGRTDNHVKIRYYALVRMHKRNLPDSSRVRAGTAAGNV